MLAPACILLRIFTVLPVVCRESEEVKLFESMLKSIVTTVPGSLLMYAIFLEEKREDEVQNAQNS